MTPKQKAKYIETILPTCRPLPEYPGYLISERGALISTQRGKYSIKTWHSGRNGYIRSTACYRDKNRTVFKHRAVLSAFKPVTGWRNLHVDHMDGNPANNSITNLIWATAKENAQSSIRRGTFKKKLTDDEVKAALEQTKFNSYREVSEMFGITMRHLYDLRNGKGRRYKHGKT